MHRPTTRDVAEAIRAIFPDAVRELGGFELLRDHEVYRHPHRDTVAINTEHGGAASALFDYGSALYRDGADNQALLDAELHRRGFPGYFEQENTAVTVWIADENCTNTECEWYDAPPRSDVIL